MACVKHGHFSVVLKSDKMDFLPNINTRNKELQGGIFPSFFTPGRIFNAHKSKYCFISDENRNNLLCIQRL